MVNVDAELAASMWAHGLFRLSVSNGRKPRARRHAPYVRVETPLDLRYREELAVDFGDVALAGEVFTVRVLDDPYALSSAAVWRGDRQRDTEAEPPLDQRRAALSEVEDLMLKTW
jgi:hypothetical protein